MPRPQTSRPHGLVLAGGLASRMHGEKPLRKLRGKTLLAHALAKLKRLCATSAVSTGTRTMALPRGIKALPDVEPHRLKGPLSGIYAGLLEAKSARADVLIVLACDLPNIPPGLLAQLLKELPGHDVAFCEHGDQPEPLVCALRVSPMLKAVASALQRAEFKVVPLWKAARCRVLTDSDLAKFRPLKRTFANVNTLAELRQERLA